MRRRRESMTSSRGSSIALPEEIRAGLRDEAGTNGLPDIRAPYTDEEEYYIIPVPRIYERTERGDRVFDLYSRLLIDRIILINREFDDRLASLVTAQLLFLESQDAEKPINIYINSPGGVVTSGLAIYDTMQQIRPEVSTTVIGQAASMGAVIALAGATGKRYALPNARIMIHQPSGGSRGTSIDIEIQTRETVRIRETLYRIMAQHTNRTEQEIFDACQRDNFMGPQEAKDFGIIDEIVAPKKKLPGQTDDGKDNT